MKFQNFGEFSQVNEEMSDTGKKEIEKMGSGFENDQEIVDAILKLGFRQLPPRTSTGEYVFLHPSSNTKYVSSTAGYVRYMDPNATEWRTGRPITTKTPIHKGKVQSSRDRLIMILRRAMKLADLYSDWKKTSLTVKEFLEKSKVILTAKKFGV